MTQRLASCSVCQSRVIQRYSEWTKIGLIALGIACDSMSDERLFSLMNLLCGELRNSLTTHLEMYCRFLKSNMFTVDTFPYEKALAMTLPEYV